jgi:CRP-like cAMP-binding protein
MHGKGSMGTLRRAIRLDAIDFSEEELLALEREVLGKSRHSLQHLAAGTILCRREELADRAWLVEHGVIAGGVGEVEDPETLFLPGSLLGLDCLLGPCRLVSVRALTEASVCPIDRAALIDWLRGGRPERIARILDAATADPRLARALDAR